MTNPDGSTLDLTGASAVAKLTWTGASHALTVSALGASGTFTVSGDASLAADIRLGQLSELWLTITDSQGALFDFVWPVVGEVP